MFRYRPRYYDPEKEERKAMFGAVDGTLDKDREKGTYVPGSSLRGAFRDGNYQRTRSSATKTQAIIGIVTLLLIVGVIYYIIKFYSLL